MLNFKTIPQLPDDPIFRLPLLFAKDPRPEKVNLGIGVYQDDNGLPTIFSSVHKAEKALLEQHLNKNYQPIDGSAVFIKETIDLLFGGSHQAIKEKRVSALQTVGGVCALRLAAEFLVTFGSSTIFISNPSWINHKNIFSRAGMDVHSYPYIDQTNGTLDFPSLAKAIEKMSAGSTILLQACGHNPTGIDPTIEQWEELSSLIKKQKIIPFFDVAYQGFADDIAKDSEAVQLFARDGHEMFAAYSYSKNMGLYGERVGALAVATKEPETLPAITSQLRQMVRGIYSTPPLQGGRIAAAILTQQNLKTEWLLELQKMRDRLHYLRNALADNLEKYTNSSDFQFLKNQKGLFSLCGLSSLQVQKLIQQYSVYLLPDGRINVAGLNDKNIEYVSHAILDVISL